MTTEPLLVLGSSFKLYKASYSSFVRSLNLLEGIAMSNSLSYKKLRFVSMIMSLFLGLKEDLESFELKEDLDLRILSYNCWGSVAKSKAKRNVGFFYI